MTAHYLMAQITELRQGLELIADARNRSNRSLASIVRVAEMEKVPIKVPQKQKRVKEKIS